MTRRLVLVALAAGAALVTAAPAHAQGVCVTHDLRPTVQAAGFVCVDRNDPDVISCDGVLGNSHYICV